MWPSRLSLRMNAHRLCRSSTSTPAVGSSSTITGGLCTSAWPTSTRRFMPPDSERMFASAFDVRSRWWRISSIQSPLSRDAEVAGLDLERLAHARRTDRTRAPAARRPARGARRGSRRRRRGPGRARVPRSARVSPARIEISVVLPAPFGPEQAEELALARRRGRRRPAPARGRSGARRRRLRRRGTIRRSDWADQTARPATARNERVAADDGLRAERWPRRRRRRASDVERRRERERSASGLPSLAARRLSASSTASAAESASPRSARSTRAVAGSAQRARRVEHRGRRRRTSARPT